MILKDLEEYLLNKSVRNNQKQKKGWRRWFRTICWLVLFAFCQNTISIDFLRVRSAYAQSVTIVPPGTLLTTTPAFTPPMLLAISIDNQDPFNINFILETEKQADIESKKIQPLIEYFLTFLAIPEKDLWVNLSPYESDKIVDPSLEMTPVGRDMLIQDYILKQLSASMSYPEREPGITFWNKVNTKIKKDYGDIDIPADMFSKVWVVPEQGVVYEQDNAAYIAESRLKVLLDEDYLSLKNNTDKKSPLNKSNEINQLYTTIAREVIIPELEREVNEGKHFTELRQMYRSLILAIWFKQKLHEHIVNVVYADQKKLSGIELEEKKIGEKIYSQYLETVKKGAYNIIREEYDPVHREIIAKKYFSGGFSLGNSKRWFKVLPDSTFEIKFTKLLHSISRKFFELTVSLIPEGTSKDKILDIKTSLKDKKEEKSQKPANIKNFNQLLAAIINGEQSLENQNTLNSVIQSIIDLQRAGQSSILEERIDAYGQLIQNNALVPLTIKEKELLKFRNQLSQEQLQTVYQLHHILQQMYLSLAPLEALKNTSALPLSITLDKNINEDKAKQVATKIVNAQKVIESTFEDVSWEGDTLFSNPISLKIIESYPSDTPISYNEKHKEIHIFQDAVILNNYQFKRAVKQAIQDAQTHRIARYLQNMLNLNEQKTEQLKEKISQLIEKETPLNEFILFLNMKEHIDYKIINHFLDLTLSKGLLEYDALVDQIDTIEEQDLQEIKQLRTKKANPLLDAFVNSFANITTFLRNNPAVAAVPLILIATVSGAHADNLNTAGMDLSAPAALHAIHGDTPALPSAADINTIAQQTLQINDVSQAIINRGDYIPDSDSQYFDFLKNFLNINDIQQMNQETSPASGKKYQIDLQYMKRNWEKVFNAKSYGWPQEAVIITAQKKLGISMDGDLGPETRFALQKKINEKSLNATQTAPEPAQTRLVEKNPQPDTLKESATPNSSAQKIFPNLKLKASHTPGQTTPIVPTQDKPDALTPAGLKPEKKKSPEPNVQIAALLEKNEAYENPIPQAAKTTTVQKVYPEVPHQISSEIMAVPDESTLVSHAQGIVTGLNTQKKSYKKGDLIFSLNDPQIAQEKERLNGQLRIENQRLAELNGLQMQHAATQYEIKETQGSILELQKQLNQIQRQETVQEVRAPFDIRVKNFSISNNLMLSNGAPILNYLNNEKIRLSIDLPLNVSSFNQIQDFQVNGQKVKSITNASLVLNPNQDGFIATFTVMPASSIKQGETVKVEAKIPPPQKPHSELDQIKGISFSIGSVVNIEEEIVSVPESGSVAFLVNEGDAINAGESIVSVDNTAFLGEYKNIMLAYNNVQERINLAATDKNNVQHISRMEIEKLEKEKVALLAQLKTLKTQIKNLQIFAPQTGIISSVSSFESTTFQQGDELLRIKTGRVILGDMNMIQNAILLPLDITLSIDDPVLVETANKVRLPGKIIAVNRNPKSEETELNNVQAVQIIAEDLSNVLGKNEPVKIIIPESKSQNAITQTLTQIDNKRQQIGKASSQGTAIKSLNLRYKKSKTTPIVIKPQTYKSTDKSGSSSFQGKELAIAELAQSIAQNNLLTGGLNIEYLQKKISEEIPTSKRLSLSAGVFIDSDGKLAFSSGLNGVIQGISGGFETGSAVGAALPFVFNLSGQIIDLITGKPQKEKQLAIFMTEIAKYHLQDAITEQISDATLLLIEISEAQQHIQSLADLLQDLQEARESIQARYRSGYSVIDEINAIDQKMENIGAEMLNWKRTMNTRTTKLNNLLGASRSQLNETIVPQIIWDGTFPAISDNEEKNLFVNLTSKNSENYQMKQAWVALKAMEQTIQLQKLDMLPAIDLHSLYLTDGENFNPMYDVISGSILKSSSLSGGYNGTLKFNFDLIDTGKKARQSIVTLEREKVILNIEQTKTKLNAQLSETISEVRNLSQEIQFADYAYNRALEAWKQKAERPDLYTSSQLVGERTAVSDALNRSIALKAKYHKTETQLRRLQVFSQTQSTVIKNGPSRLFSPSRMSDTGAQGRYATPANYAVAEQGNLLIVPDVNRISNAQNPAPAKKASGLFTPGEINYPDTNVSTNPNKTLLWGLMTQSDSTLAASGIPVKFASIYTILTSDDNVLNRRAALNDINENYLGDANFPDLVEHIALNTHYQDVATDLLISLVKRPNTDPRIFFSILDHAIKNHKTELIEQGFMAINDLFVDHPTIFQDFNELSIFTDNHISREDTRRILLSFLAYGPDTSIAKTSLIQGDYWTDYQLADIHRSLESCRSKSTDDAIQKKASDLSRLIYDEILRRKMLENIDEIYSLGRYKNLQSGVSFEHDKYIYFMIKKLAVVNEHFLTTSPDWREMKNYVSEELFQSALTSTETLINRSTSSLSTGTQEPFTYINPKLSGGKNTTAFFNSLGTLQQKKAFISGTNSPSMLACVLQDNASKRQIRGMVMDQLMQLPTGPILVLEDYVLSQDKNFLSFIEAQNWRDSLPNILATINNPNSRAIVRSALKKMHHQTKEPWILDYHAATYDLLELNTNGANSISAVQRQKQIDLAAMDIAVEYVQEKEQYQWRLWALNRNFTEEELTVFNDLREIITKTASPDELEKYITMRKTDSHCPKILNEIIKNKEKIKDVISSNINNQDLPKIPLVDKLSIGGFLLIFFRLLMIKIHPWRIIRQKDNNKLIRFLRRELAEDNGNGKRNGTSDKNSQKDGYYFSWKVTQEAHHISDETVSPPLNKNLNGKFTPLFQGWYQHVYQWNTQEADAQTIIDGSSNILNNIYEIIRLSAYTPKLIINDEDSEKVLNNKYQAVCNYFIKLSADTLNVLNEKTKDLDMNHHQREQLAENTKKFAQTINYMHSYFRILDSRGDIDKVMGYKFYDDHPAEIIYRVLRFSLLYQMRIKTSQKRIQTELKNLMDSGNKIIKNLYPNKEGYYDNSLELLDRVIANAEYLSSPGRAASHSLGDKMRSFKGRLLMFAFQMISLSGVILGPGVHVGVSILGLFGFLISVNNYWSHHLKINQMLWSPIMHTLTNRYTSELMSRFNVENTSNGDAFDDEIQKQNTVKNAINNGLLFLKNELDEDARPSADMIMIIPQSPENREDLMEYVEDRRGKIFREDIPVEVIDIKKHGKANAYLEALQKARNLFNDKTYQKKYSAIQGKKWEDINIMFVFQDEKASINQSSILDWTIMSGYSSMSCISGACSLNEEDRNADTIAPQKAGSSRRHMILFTKDAYFGPMEESNHEASVLYVKRVNEEELSGRGLVHFILDNGRRKIKQIWEKLNVQDIIEENVHNETKRTKHRFLEENFDLTNSKIKQYPALIGRIIFDDNTISVMENVLKEMEKNPQLWEKLQYLHLVIDIINILAKSRNEVMNRYLDARLKWPDIQKNFPNTSKSEIYDAFKEFYTLIQESDEFDSVNLEAFLPHPSSSHLETIRQKEDALRLKPILKTIENAIEKNHTPLFTSTIAHSPEDQEEDHALTTAPERKGGLDFSSTRNRLKFQADEIPIPVLQTNAPVNPDRPLPLLPNFRGFHFNITKLHPVEDPIQFLSSLN